MIEVVLGVDIGTSGVRVVARDVSGTLKSMASAVLEAPTADFGRVLQDPHMWWAAIERAFAALNLEGLQVLALAVDGTSGTVLPVDGVGNVLGLASMYNDIASPELVKCIKDNAPPETAAHGATSALARLIPMQQDAPQILHQADWIMGRFCGVFNVTDENNALKSGYDPVLRQWPDWILRAGGQVEKLPHVVAAGTRVGTIKADMADAFHLPRDVAIVTGTTDGCAAFLASGAREAGDGVTSLGTTLTLKLLSATPVFAPQYGIYSHRIGEQWLAGGASNTGGATLKQFFSVEEIVTLTPLMDANVATGLDYYPLPKTGERFPIYDPAMQPRLSPRPADDHVFLQGLLEGLSAVEVLGYRRLTELGASALRSIRTVGGGAANEVWTAIRLKQLGVPALQPVSEHAAMGTARLAWRGIGHDA